MDDMQSAVTVAVAQVWRFGRRRYLSKRAACAAQAKKWMQRDHIKRFADDPHWVCDCMWCEDRTSGGSRIHKRLTRYLMRRSNAR